MDPLRLNAKVSMSKLMMSKLKMLYFSLASEWMMYPFLVCFIDSYSFSICDTSDFSEYKKGGVVTEVKQSKTFSFVSMRVIYFKKQHAMASFFWAIFWASLLLIKSIQMGILKL